MVVITVDFYDACVCEYAHTCSKNMHSVHGAWHACTCMSRNVNEDVMKILTI